MAKRKAQSSDQGRQWELPTGAHVWAYLRHSPGDAQTIDSQKHGMHEWCTQNGWMIDGEFVDEGIEGSKEEREQFQAMMAQAKQQPRPVDGIAVWSFSRFARDQLDSQFYKADLRKRGYVVVSKIDDIPSNEMAPIFEAVIDWKNQRFLEDLSADVRRGQIYLIEQGYLPGAFPAVGYRVNPEEIGRRRNGEIRYGNRVVKDEELTDRVALAWKMKLETNASYGEIHQATHLFKVPHTYATFFDNWLYAGIFDYGGKRYPIGWEQGAHFCEPYVTVEQFMRVQQNRKRRTIDKIAPRSLSSAYLLTSLLHCSYCEAQGLPSSMSGAKHTVGDSRYYRCTGKATGRTPTCKMPHIACWKADDAVFHVLKEMVLTPEYVAAELEQANNRLASKGDDLRVQLRQAELNAQEQEQRVESIVKLIGKKGLTAVLERQYDEANTAWLEATARLAALRSESVQSQARQIALADVQRCLDDLVNILDTGTIRQKQELVRRFVERITVYDDRLHIKLRFSLDTLLNKGFAQTSIAAVSYGNGFHGSAPTLSNRQHGKGSSQHVVQSQRVRGSRHAMRVLQQIHL